MNRNQTIAVALVALVVVSGIGIAAYSTIPTSGTVPLQTNSNLTVAFENTNELDGDPFQDNQTLNVTGGELSSASGGELRVSSNFNISDRRTFTVTETGSERVWINKTDSQPVAINGSGADSLTIEPGIAANDNRDDLEYSASGPADITVDGLAADDTYQLIAGDGTALALSTADSSGTVTFEDVREGDYDNIEIRTGVLEIRTMTENPQLVKNTANVTVRLFEEDKEEVFVREATNGTVGLGEFPDQTQFSVLVKADGFETRRTVINSVREQSTVYLADENASTSLVRFEIEDRTGDFSGSNSATIQIERSVNTSASGADKEEYKAIAGDVVGGQLTFDTTLEDNVRYRVSVSNDQGDTRQLGAFSIESDRVINLVISGIDQGVDLEEGSPVVNTTLTEASDTEEKLQFVFTDPESETTEINVRIENVANSSDVLDTASKSGEISQFKYSRTVNTTNNDKEYVANYTYVRNGQTTSATVPFGTGQYPVLTNLGDGWQQIFGVGALLVMGGVFSVGNARIGALIIPGAALTLYMIGFLDGVVTIFGVGVAFSIGVAVNLLAGDAGGVT